jgi:hypothetical protein
MMTMWPTAAMIADYLEERLPDKDGEIHVASTSKLRDQIVVTLRQREGAEPFLLRPAAFYLAMTSC